MKEYILWSVMIGSGFLLCLILLRNQFAFQRLGRICLHIALAVTMLYVVNLLSGYTHLVLPLNAVTIGTVSLLGVPGLAVLAALKMWVV